MTVEMINEFAIFQTSSGLGGGGGGGVGGGEVQRKYSRKGKLNEKKFMHAN